MANKIYDANFILNLSKVGDLFCNDLNSIKKDYKAMVKIWHPDINKSEKSSIVFNKINMLYIKALELIKDGKWEKTGLLQLITEDNKTLNVRFFSCINFELGKIYICDKYVVYIIDKDKEIFFENAIYMIQNLEFFDINIKNQIKIFLPQDLNCYYLKSREYCIAIKKDENVFNLLDVFNYYRESFDDRHAAWIISRLLNLVCYFDFADIVHNGITINNCFICPKTHSVFLYGGWWYSTKKDEKMIGMSSDTFSVLPIFIQDMKLSNIMADLESVRLIGRKLLKNSKNVPLPFKEWLKQGCAYTAIDEMKRWDNAILESYEKRKFIKMNISKNDIYNNINI